jgi:TP901 family phage tail tape measure protein
MANPSGIRSGRAWVEIFADNSQFIAGLKAAETQLMKFGSNIEAMGKKMMGLGMAVFTPLVGASKVFASTGEELHLLSQKTGLSVEMLSQMKFAADQSGVSLESLAKGFKMMEKNIYGSGQGFAKIGVTAAQLKSMRPEEQFATLADRLSKIQNPGQRAALAMQLFGRAGSDLLPFLENGAAGINELMETAQKMGFTWSEQDVKAAVEFQRAIKLLWFEIKNLTARIGQALIPAFEGILNYIGPLIKKFTEWVQTHQGTINTIASLAAALIAGGAAAMVFGRAFSVLASIMSGIRTTFSYVGSLIATLGTVITGLLTPLGLTIGAVAGLTGLWLAFTDSGQQTFNYFKTGLSGFADDFKTTLGAIGNALAKGDLGTAAKVAWLFIKMEFIKGKVAVEKLWIEFKTGLLEYWYSGLALFGQGWDAVMFTLKEAWINAIWFLKNAWSGFKEWWSTSVDWVAKKITDIYIDYKTVTDPNFDEKAARKTAETSFNQSAQQRQDQRNKELGDANREFYEADAKLEKQYQSLLNKAASGAAPKIKQLLDEKDAQIKELEDELAKAKGEWQDSVNTANTPGPGKTPPPPPPPPDTGAQLQYAFQTVSAGTFNSFAAGNIGGSTVTVMADHMNSINKNTQKMVDTLNNMYTEMLE